jgi:hypothetical protein
MLELGNALSVTTYKFQDGNINLNEFIRVTISGRALCVGQK